MAPDGADRRARITAAQLNIAAAYTPHGNIAMTKDVIKTNSPASNFAKLKKLFGPPPVLSSEDPKAYDTIMARFIECLKASDFIEQMFVKDLTDAPGTSSGIRATRPW